MTYETQIVKGKKHKNNNYIMRDCKGCAECCLSLTENNKFLIPLTKADAARLRKNPIFQDLQKKKIIWISKGTYDYFYPYDLIANKLCPFLDLDLKICNIYPDRPSNCKSFFCEEFENTPD
jgi:Fe-S-cluster containining protein